MVICVVIVIVTRRGKRNNFPFLVTMEEAIQIHLKNCKIILIIIRQKQPPEVQYQTSRGVLKYAAHLQENANPEV